MVSLGTVRTAVQSAEPRPSAPVLLWAAAGAVSCAVILRGWAGWLTSSELTASPHGPDPIGHGSLITIRVVEIISVTTGILIVWRFLVQPLLRERRLSFDGKMILAAIGMWFYDPLANVFNLTFYYNTYFLQFRSWVSWIPGFNTPNADGLAQPVLFTFGAYMWFVFGFPVLGCWILGKLRQRYATTSTLGLFSLLFPVFMVIDLIVEVAMARMQVWIYPGIPNGLGLWMGNYYQFPIYEPVFVAIFLSGMTSLRYLRDDQGRSFVERGVEKLKVSTRSRQALSMLAITGFLHSLYVFGYWGPYSIMALHADTFPPLPSYLRQSTCGEGTAYACPSRYVPIPHPGSLHVSPDDPRLPDWVRARQRHGAGRKE